MANIKKYTVISLFAGCGGLDLGFLGGFKFLGKNYSKNNFEIAWANDIDQRACDTYEKNFGHKIVCADINDVLSDKKGKYNALPKSADIVLGGFPCQDFSHAGKRRGFTAKRGNLYQSMIEVIKKTKPQLFIAENVKGLLTMDKGGAIKQIVSDFEKLGYHVEFKLYLAANFGVPQMRERVIIIGTNKKKLPAFVHTEEITDNLKWVPLKDAIGDLEKAPLGQLPNHFWSEAKKNKGQGNGLVKMDKPGPTMRAEHHGNIEWHWNGKRRLSAREAARIQSFPDNFVFVPSTSSAYKQIGNAVAPVMGWHIAKAVQKFLDKNLSK